MDFVKAKLIKDYLRKAGAGGVSPELIKKINEDLEESLNKALIRTISNNRTIVMKRDW